MNNDLIYPVSMIFSSDHEEGALNRLEATAFFIASYQRGYKWASDSSGAVVKLLNDLYGAFKAGSKEYYLQYITTKVSKHKNETVLEVIDGQQRLTTLTLLFSVFSYFEEDANLGFTKNKLHYQVRENVASFFEHRIYNDIVLLYNNKWEQFIIDHPQYNEQDIFYLFHACKVMFSFLEKQESEISSFANFVANHVKVILNNVSGAINSEKIFANLNSNKVELTDVELVKGLFLTKAAREKTFNRTLSHQQVTEERALIGRQWDDIVGWTYVPEIRAIYFSKENDPIYTLLSFFAFSYGFRAQVNNNDRYKLFNFFQDQINTGKVSARLFFSELKSFKMILDNWCRNDEIFNTLGFLVHCKGSTFKLEDVLPFLKFSVPDVKLELRKKALSILPENVEILDYNEHDHGIHAVLLALSVFLNTSRFNFKTFAQEKWSLEHIFPQKPDHLPEVMYEHDLRLLRSLMQIPIEKKELLIKTYGDIDQEIYTGLVKKMSELPTKLTEEEKQMLYRFINSGSLNGIGNMALLSGSDNSSNKNGMFFTKRHNLIKRISNGSFVPKHTYDVFSKLLSDQMDKDTSVWSKRDITAHKIWVLEKIQGLHKTLTNLK